MTARGILQGLASIACVACVALAMPSPVRAQNPPNPVDFSVEGPAGGQGLEPGDDRPRLPEPLGSDEAESSSPTLDVESATEPESRLQRGLAVYVERFVVEGSSVFSADELAGVLAPWTGRRIESEELLDARDAITRLYVEHGYVTSGAIVPDQDVEAGIVRLQVIEGRIEQIEVRGNRHFRAHYFETRLARAAVAPVRIGQIERTLRILQRDDWIERVDAVIEPGDRLGESRLVLEVTERARWQLSAEAGNENSPAIGSATGILEGRVANLAGVGDVLTARFQATAGLLDFEGRFEVPITPWDTRLHLRARVSSTELQESPFASLDIESKAQSYGVSLFQPLHRTESDEVWLQLSGEWRAVKSTVLGQAFCFELVIEDCARPRIAALRTGLQWTRRTQRDVISARTLFSWGLETLNATTGGPINAPDAKFFVWLGQAQWAHVFPDSWLGTQLLLRGDVQLADDPLLSLEKIAVGGWQTVRGYRENQLVRDNAVILSGEFRIPVWRDSLRRPLVELVPFMDWGRAWNHRSQSPTEMLWSVGAGLRATPRKGVLAEVYWGGRLEGVPNPRDSLQDYGLYMRIRVDAPEVF